MMFDQRFGSSRQFQTSSRGWAVRLAIVAFMFVMIPSVGISQEPKTETTASELEKSSETIDSRRDRLVAVALVGSAFLALLGVLFFYLRFDHASRGFYSGRLQMASLIAAVIILLVCYLLWTQVVFK